MKKLILSISVVLLFAAISFAQNDIYVTAGRTKVLELKAPGNYTSYTLLFVAKNSNNERVIQKTLSKSYATPYTTMVCTLNVSDTQDLTTNASYPYDIVAYGADTITIKQGKLNILSPVQTAFDGTNLPSGGTRVTTVSLDNGTKQDEMVTWDAINHRWSPTGSILPQAQKDSISAMIRDSLRTQNPPYVLSIVRPKQIEDITFDFLFKDIIIDSIQGTTYDSSFTMNLFYGNYIASGGTAIYPTVQTVSAVNPSYNSIIGGGVIPKNNYLRIYINPSGIIGEYYVIKIFYH